MSWLEKTVVGLLVVLALTGFAFYKGYHYGYAAAESEYKAKIAKIKEDAQKEADALRARGRELEAQLVEAKGTVEVKYKETIRYVYKNARANHRAMDAALTRMLNQLTGIRESSEADGSSSGRTDAARPEASSDSGRSAGASGATSERSLAEWITEAVTSHEKCRLQVSGLIEYAKACSGIK